MMPRLNRTTRKLPLLLLIVFALSACSGLAGDVEIVATVAPASAGVTMPPNPPDVANGERIFLANCTQCHGENGAGDGALVQSGEVPRMPSFQEGTHVRQQTPAAYYEIITNGNLENLMPPWADSLSEQERWDVAMYTYTRNYTPDFLQQGEALYQEDAQAVAFSPMLSDRQRAEELAQTFAISLENAEAIAAYERIQTLSNYGISAADLPESVNLSVLVENGTTGSATPDALPVLLIYGDFSLPDGIVQQEGTLTENSAIFADVPVEASYEYFALTTFANVRFVSEQLTGFDLTEDRELSIDIYELTTDPASVTLTAIDYLVEQLSVPEMGTGLVIRQTNTYINDTDRVFWLPPDVTGTSRAISVAATLPPASFVMATNDRGGNRYIIADQEGIIIDTLPINPGEHVVEFQYFVPYETGAVIDQPLNTALDGTVTLDFTTTSLTVRDERFTQVAAESITQPNVAARYQAEYQLANGESLQFELAGSLFASENTSTDPNIVPTDALLPVLLVVAIGLVVLTVVLFWLQGRGDKDRQIDNLLQQLATLEKMHDAGQINHDVYRKQQSDLQARLEELRGDVAPGNDPSTNS